MQPLPMHKHQRNKKLERNQLLFARIATSQSVDERFWIKIVNYLATAQVQYLIHRTNQKLGNIIDQNSRIEVEINEWNNSDHSQFFVLPSNTKWEIIVDLSRGIIDFIKLSPDAIVHVFCNSSEPFAETPQTMRTALDGSPFPSEPDGVLPISLKIAIGSSLQQRFKRLHAFRAMKLDEPDMVILTGNNIYLDMIPYQCGCLTCLSLVHKSIECK